MKWKKDIKMKKRTATKKCIMLDDHHSDYFPMQILEIIREEDDSYWVRADVASHEVKVNKNLVKCAN